MGQQSSANKEAVICCTTRGDDEARPGESVVYASCQAREDRSAPASPPRLVGSGDTRDEGREESFNDGGTGGTGTKHARHESAWGNPCVIAPCAMTCIEERSADTAAGRRALFGDKSLKPRLMRLKTKEGEVEALMTVRAQISKRLPDTAGKTIAVPAVLEAGLSRIPEAELVRRLRLHEESLANCPERFVTQACVRVLGTTSVERGAGSAPLLAERSVELTEMKKHYTEILNTVDVLVQERISQLHAELTKLDAEVGEIEDLISLCFDKMDEEATGSISSGRFVAFVCTQETQEMVHPEPDIVVVSPEDAESLFIQMSGGQGEITFEQFKDEITVGCLQVLQANINLRRHMQKRYRDWWA